MLGGREIPVGPGTAFSTAAKRLDKNVTFEEYLYHARITRADQRYEELNPDYKLFGITFKKNRNGGKSIAEHIGEVMGGEVSVPAPAQTSDEKAAPPLFEKDAERAGRTSTSSPMERGIADDEYTLASRALRTAGWSSIFFLITTDILGPFNVPTAMAYVSLATSLVISLCGHRN